MQVFGVQAGGSLVALGLLTVRSVVFTVSSPRPFTYLLACPQGSHLVTHVAVVIVRFSPVSC